MFNPMQKFSKTSNIKYNGTMDMQQKRKDYIYKQFHHNDDFKKMSKTFFEKANTSEDKFKKMQNIVDVTKFKK
ncbi:MAG: hypothetical protein ACK5HL_03395 [Bacilli bacterium]